MIVQDMMLILQMENATFLAKVKNLIGCPIKMEMEPLQEIELHVMIVLRYQMDPLHIQVQLVQQVHQQMLFNVINMFVLSYLYLYAEE